MAKLLRLLWLLLLLLLLRRCRRRRLRSSPLGVCLPLDAAQEVEHAKAAAGGQPKLRGVQLAGQECLAELLQLVAELRGADQLTHRGGAPAAGGGGRQARDGGV